MFKPQPSTQFKHDVKKARKQNKDIAQLQQVITLLAKGTPLDKKYLDHELSGPWKGYRELHLAPDWLLIYRIARAEQRLKLMRLGDHAHLFTK